PVTGDGSTAPGAVTRRRQVWYTTFPRMPPFQWPGRWHPKSGALPVKAQMIVWVRPGMMCTLWKAAAFRSTSAILLASFGSVGTVVDEAATLPPAGIAIPGMLVLD